MSRGLPHNVKQCLEKSRDGALLAIETYNKPAINKWHTFSINVWLTLRNIRSSCA